MSTYDQAVTEARAIFGDPKAIKDAVTVAVMQAPTSREYFAVRGTRLDALKAEGFIHIASLDHGGNVTKIST